MTTASKTNRKETKVTSPIAQAMDSFAVIAAAEYPACNTAADVSAWAKRHYLKAGYKRLAKIIIGKFPGSQNGAVKSIAPASKKSRKVQELVSTVSAEASAEATKSAKKNLVNSRHTVGQTATHTCPIVA